MVETMEALGTFISTVGFPVFACCALGYMLYRFNKTHAEEINGMRDALTANTTAISKLEALITELYNTIKGGEKD